MTLPTLPSTIPGMCPQADLVWLVDASRYNLSDYDAPAIRDDGVLAGWQKTSEGGPTDKPWSTSKDADLEAVTLDAAIQLAVKNLEVGLAIGDGYHYTTEGRDGSHHYFDGEDEVTHALRLRDAFFKGIREHGFDPLAQKRLVFLYDAEDFKRPMSAAERLSILFYVLERLKSELGYAPTLYINATTGVKPYLRDENGARGEPIAEPTLRKMVGRFPLFQPDYDSNTMASLPQSLETGPTQIAEGWSEVDIWQLRSTYQNGLDLSVGDNRRIWTP